MTTAEKRRDDRLPVLWRGTLTDENDNAFACEVRDISHAGTLISCDTDLELGTELILTIDSLGEFACKVKWQGSKQHGLAILAGPDLALKKFAETSGSELSTEPTPPTEDPLSALS